MANVIETYDKIVSESKCADELKNVAYASFQSSYPGVLDLDKLVSPTGNLDRITIFKQSDFN